MARTGPGRPWTNLNQGQKIMFGAPTYLTTRETGDSATVLPVEAAAKNLNGLSAVSSGPEFPVGLPIIDDPYVYIGYTPSFWILSNKRYAYRYTQNSIRYNGKDFIVPSELGDYATPIGISDVNVTADIIVATGWYRQARYVGINFRTFYYWVILSGPVSVSGQLLEIVYSEEHEATAHGSGPLIPAISPDCSVVYGGMGPSAEVYLDLNPNVPFRVVYLDELGQFAGAEDGVWQTGWVPASSVQLTVPMDPPDLDAWGPASNDRYSLRPNKTRSSNTEYSVGAVVFGSLLGDDNISTGETAYITCVQAGKTSTTYVAMEGKLGATITDGTVVWQVSGGLSDWPEYIPPVLRDINSAAVSDEYVDGVQQSLEEYIAEVVAKWQSDYDPPYQYEIVVPPNAFTNQYPYYFYVGDQYYFAQEFGIPDGYYGALPNYAHTSFVRAAAVRRFRYLENGELEEGKYTFVSVRYLRYYVKQRYNNLPAVVETGMTRGAGEYPLGWVRNSSGVIERIYYKNKAISQVGTVSGTNGGARISSYGFLFTPGGPPAETAILESLRPAPVGYSYTLTETFTGPGGNGTARDYYVGDLPVGSFIDGPDVYTETTQYSYTPTNHSQGTDSYSYTRVHTNETHQDFWINWQAKFAYNAKHVLPGNAEASTDSHWEQATIVRTRSFIFNGSLIAEDSYTVGSGLWWQPYLEDPELIELAPVGRPDKNEFIMSVYSYQGANDSSGWPQWGPNSGSVDPGQFQLLVGSNGYFYTELPTPTGVVPIDASWNVESGLGQMISLNLK